MTSYQRHGTTEMLVDFLLKRNMDALEIGFAIPQKVKHRNNMPCIHSSPTHLLKRNKNTKTCMQIFITLLI